MGMIDQGVAALELLYQLKELKEDNESLKQENDALHQLVDDLSKQLEMENKKDTAGNGV